MTSLTTALLAVPVVLALGGCTLLGGGGGGQLGYGPNTPGTPGTPTPDPDPGPTDPNPDPGPGPGPIAEGAANSAVLVFPGNTGGLVQGRGLTHTEFEINENGTARYRLGEIPDLSGQPVQAISDGIELAYDASGSSDGLAAVRDYYMRAWTFVGSPPEAASGGGGADHAWIYRAIGDVQPEHVTIGHTIRESLHGLASQHPDLAARYVGYHVAGEITGDMPADATLHYDGKFIGNRNTDSTSNQGPHMGGGFNGDLSLTATLSGGAGSVEGSMDAVNGFLGARTRIDFAGDVQGASFDARDITISPSSPDRVEILSVRDTSAVQGNFFGPGAGEVGGVFLIEGDWNDNRGVAGGPYYLAGSFFGTQSDQ